ncbi:hypothetical protein ES332_A11G313500v1 [Gossypium tomentosum]|uniref:Uncharacterized protein n=1 Tax=Gossypium tomentosum TaxID=34277 RepID=A0A5D2NHJ2_GOSTO|nr:hypothetical protein ES332_A11G313500v1 [Gossypium tomentosum]
MGVATNPFYLENPALSFSLLGFQTHPRTVADLSLFRRGRWSERPRLTFLKATPFQPKKTKRRRPLSPLFGFDFNGGEENSDGATTGWFRCQRSIRDMGSGTRGGC